MSLYTNMRLLTGKSSEDILERKNFADWILTVGDGTIGEITDEDIKLSIPNDLLLQSCNDPIASIVASTYPSFLQARDDHTYFQQRVILTPKNDIANHINDYMSAQLPGEEQTYLSIDSPHSDNIHSDRIDNVHSSEFLNTISSSGLPNHILKLKIGVPVMLLRNVDHKSGLCNGTRLIITRLGK